MEGIGVDVQERRWDEQDVVHERDRLKMRVAVLEESVRSYEVECKASRETVMRLVSELGCERKTAASTAELLESLRLELKSALVSKRSADIQKQSLLERLETITELEKRLSDASESVVLEAELCRGALKRAELGEQQVQELRESLRGLEAELLAADVHRDGLTHSREHYEQFLEQLSEKMKVDSIAADLGFDMRLHLILSRAEQLVKQEGTALLESKTLTHGLQRKLKALKERLQSKELHMELLRKKLYDLEQEKNGRSTLAVQRDDAQLEARKLQKKLERLRGELGSAKLSNTELKAQLSHTNELKLQVLEQSQSLGEQSGRLEELEKGKAEVESSLTMVRSDLQSWEMTAREDQQHLATLRQTLAQLTERERELADFRMVVSKMVGLDVTSLTLPDYEIIKHLEGLFNTHHQHHSHLHYPHFHLHHPRLPWPYPAQQHPHQPWVQGIADIPGSRPALSAASLRPAAPQALPLHET
ncbi:coiled-coil domain-containing protein 170 isoform X2 [Hypomesus transpacificus]|uniref:coiled-coil domain-containing protein 170 isoform X2 n=1 Tax=Hypomesus transpacificus TaxID=137520 RepID=UPI001F07D01C|nr:coiled-coil domain-containing protein 170 isoform X2 [Hypomesus transpacificus]